MMLLELLLKAHMLYQLIGDNSNANIYNTNVDNMACRL